MGCPRGLDHVPDCGTNLVVRQTLFLAQFIERDASGQLSKHQGHRNPGARNYWLAVDDLRVDHDGRDDYDGLSHAETSTGQRAC